MPLESASFIDGLVATNPLGTDTKSQGDDHLRLIKSTIKATFPNITGAVTPTQAQLNGISSGQYVFPAVQVPSADPNTLDDYEEGTFTPGLTFGGGSTGMTFAVQVGRYTKVGRQVSFIFDLTLTARGSSTGTALLTGLPFTSAAGISVPCAGLIEGFSADDPRFEVLANSTTIAIYSFASSTLTPATHPPFFNTSTIRVAGIYFV